MTMFWTAVASSTLTSERSAGMASGAPSYQQQHTKPLFRSSASNWQLSNAAFKQQQLLQQHQKQIRRQEEEEALRQEQLSLEQIAWIDEQAKKEPKDVKKKKVASCKKKISLKSGCKIFKAFTCCKCTEK